MSHKLGICIPYRDRETHLKKLIPRVSKHLEKQNIDHCFYVGHQVDDKLFNRGAMKNIAAFYAFKDGCDYIAWHDVDMLPHKDVDYSYPDKTPIHIATKLTKYNYGMGYDQYFGGVVLFNKEHVEKTNGYSNEYWDWGQEDDDLFWRCYYENYVKSNVFEKIKDDSIGVFNGVDSYIMIPSTKKISQTLKNNHTISILFNAEQQPKKHPIYLVGDKNKKYVEFPLLRKIGAEDWGLSFNNSRAATMRLVDIKKQKHYNWGKRFEDLWTKITLSYNEATGLVYFYINNELVSYKKNIKTNNPFLIREKLKLRGFNKPFILGGCDYTDIFYKGKIASFKIYNDFFENPNKINEQNIVLDFDFSEASLKKLNGKSKKVKFIKEDIEIIENIIPHRKEGSFLCLPHKDLGYVGDSWVQGETTAKNEKRLITKMQQKKINYREEGFNRINDLVVVDRINDNFLPNTYIIDTKMIIDG